MIEPKNGECWYCYIGVQAGEGVLFFNDGIWWWDDKFTDCCYREATLRPLYRMVRAND